MKLHTSALAQAYFADIHASKRAAVDGEPEAQLTTPIANLFTQVATAGGLGMLRLIRESRLDRTRPDFAILQTSGSRTHQKGYLELKAPGVPVDASAWTGRNARQWQTMKAEAEILIVCNGQEARLYKDGAVLGEDAILPFQDPLEWDARPLLNLLQRFLECRPTPVTNVRDLSRRLAIRTADLRDRLLWLLQQSDDAGKAARGGYESWKGHVHPDASERDFADGASQVVSYGMVLAALSGSRPDSNRDGYISVAEARQAIRSTSPVMAAAFAPLVDKPDLFTAVHVELGALETLVSAIDRDRVNRSADHRGEPWLYFYEDFLSVYDPNERRQAGVYYTPLDIVRAMVNMVDHILVEQLGKRLSFADQTVFTLDPATGTGTFPLAVIDAAAKRLQQSRGPAGASQAASTLARTLLAFELLPGPYSVAHLRLSQRLHDLDQTLQGSARVVLTDTLESPLDPQEQFHLFGDAEVLAAEQNKAKRIKLHQRVTVVLGNPPYRRVERNVQGRGSGGWVVEGQVPSRRTKKSLFDDILDVARKHTVFSHHASLYNLYVYFWRWAIWKAFEAHGGGPGVVSFITASSWLTGPGFVGLRQLVRQLCDDVWVLDLGGDNSGPSGEENVFAIETPVAVVVLVRKDQTNPDTPATIHYRRLAGSAKEKLSSMATISNSGAPLEGDWLTGPSGWLDPFSPATGSAAWQEMPLLTDLFPWQQPGCMHSRSWPIAPTPDVLLARWKHFAASDLDQRPALYITPRSGRSIHTKVGALPRLSEIREGEAPEQIVRYGYRSFDRQWSFADPRLAKTESPALWSTRSPKQVFLVTLASSSISDGPCLVATDSVPDKHYFRGSYGGKDVIPLYRDAAGSTPNVTAGLLTKLATELGLPRPSPEDLAAYVYALLSAPGFQKRFAEELKTPGARVPLTADSALWREAVELGRILLWLHTYGERYVPTHQQAGSLPHIPELAWDKTVRTLPASADELTYDPVLHTISIGDGRVSGVQPAVWLFTVSGMQVVKRWLSYRTRDGAGRAASSENELDRIRPTCWPDEWNDEFLDLLRILTRTIQLHEEHSSLLERVLGGKLISASDLPSPKTAQRQPPG